jgi:transposase
MKQDRQAFSPEFKQEALALLHYSGKSANQLAKELGINQTTLSRWKREAEATPIGANGVQTTEELTALRREVECLRRERDILKKAAAFFARESV